MDVWGSDILKDSCLANSPFMLDTEPDIFPWNPKYLYSNLYIQIKVEPKYCPELGQEQRMNGSKSVKYVQLS